MIITYKNGSKLECSSLKIYGGEFYVDDMYMILIDDVELIED